MMEESKEIVQSELSKLIKLPEIPSDDIEEKRRCIWVLEKGRGKGGICGRSIQLFSDSNLCVAHTVCDKNREDQPKKRPAKIKVYESEEEYEEPIEYEEPEVQIKCDNIREIKNNDDLVQVGKEALKLRIWMDLMEFARFIFKN